MKRKQGSLIVVGGALILLTATSLTGSLLLPSSPLYAVRMDQASSKMDFLPTEQNTFTYVAEDGYSLTFGTSPDTIFVSYIEWPPDTIGASNIEWPPDTIFMSDLDWPPDTCPILDIWPPDTIGASDTNTGPETIP